MQVIQDECPWKYYQDLHLGNIMSFLPADSEVDMFYSFNLFPYFRFDNGKNKNTHLKQRGLGCQDLG